MNESKHALVISKTQNLLHSFDLYCFDSKENAVAYAKHQMSLDPPKSIDGKEYTELFGESKEYLATGLEQYNIQI